MPTASACFEFQPIVQLEQSEAKRITSQDCSPEEVHAVTWRGTRGDSRRRLFIPELTPTADSEVLRIRCPLRHYSAKTVTLVGPRRDARATPATLTAALTGCYVVPGARLRTTDGDYIISAMELKRGYRGFALVGGACRIRLNDSGAAIVGRTATPASPPPLIGLDEQTQELQTLMEFACELPGSVRGVVLRGPRGCGVRSILQRSLSPQLHVEVLQWTAAFKASKVREQSRSRVLLLTVQPAENYFAAEEGEVAKATLRKLLHDVQELTTDCNGQRLSVVVVTVTHRYGSHCACDVMENFFSHHIIITLPDADQRAALLAHCRGGDASTWLAEAQTLVGKTSVETLEVGRRREWHYQPPFSAVHWSEIGGLEEVKRRLRQALVWPQQQPELFSRFHITPPKGVLLYGPPGCAKTTLVKALCSEGYFSLLYLDSASVVSAYVGESERHLRDVFARAAQQAPCIVFFDEVEVLGAKRATGSHNAEQVRLLSTLLTELDGFAEACGVCFVGATNVPHLIDPALLRPGRFDYLVYVPLPAEDDRRQILSLLLSKTAADVNAVAKATEGFSGADLNALCSGALLELLRSAEQPPQSLQNSTWMTDFMLEKAASFNRAAYDISAFDKFQQEHTRAA